MVLRDPDDEAEQVYCYEYVDVDYTIRTYDDGVAQVDITGECAVYLYYEAMRLRMLVTVPEAYAADVCKLDALTVTGKILKLYREVGLASQDDSDVAEFGRLPLEIEMRMQSDEDFGSNAAMLLQALNPETIDWISLKVSNRVSDAELVAALSLELSDRVSVTETLTGAAGIYIIERRRLYISNAGYLVECWFECSPVGTYNPAMFNGDTLFNGNWVFCL